MATASAYRMWWKCWTKLIAQPTRPSDILKPNRTVRILQLTAGAAGMYCGTCLRDNSLAAALMKLGHDVTLLPLYTPTLTDEANVSNERIFFGGISVYLEQNYALFRKTPWLLDKLWDSKAALKMAAKSTIPVDPHFLGEMTVSMLQLEHGRLDKELKKMLQWLESEPRPDIVNLPYTLLIGLAAPLRKSLHSPICCTLQGEDLFLEGLQEPYKTRSLDLIRQSIPHIDCFLAVSEYYAEFMCRYLGIPDHKMEIAPLGVSTDGYRTEPSSNNSKPRIGYFARIAPEKGLHILAEAFKLVREAGFDCSLEAAGYMAPEQRPYLNGIEKHLHECGLDFKYHGALDRAQKIAYLESLDVLSTPTVYADPKGLFVLEVNGRRGSSRPAESRRVPRDHSQDRRRNPGRARKSAQPRRRFAEPPSRPRVTHRSRPPRLLGRARSLSR